MRASRIVLLLIGLAILLYLIKNQTSLFAPHSSDAGPGPASPVDRARTVKAKADTKSIRNREHVARG